MVAIAFAATIGSCSTSRQMPEPILMREVAIAAAVIDTKGSMKCRYCLGMSPPSGNGVARLAGMCVCSGNQTDSKPRSSAARAQTSGRMP